MKKKILGIIFCGILILGITGCGDKNENHIDTNKNVENNIQKENDNIEEIELGKTVSLDFVEVTLDSFEIKDRYDFKYEKSISVGTHIKNVSLEPKTSDFKLVSLRGFFTNKTSNEIYTSNKPIFGTIEINGNEYKAMFAAFNTKEAERYTSIISQQKVEYFFYVEVPTNVAEKITECKIKFGFKKDLSPLVMNFSDLDYIYSLKAIPEIK